MKYGKYEIEIKYDGAYPCLCSGHLIVIIDGKEWDFGTHVLVSGGSAYFLDDWDEVIECGDWDIYEESFPEGFFEAYPEYMKKYVIEAVNDNVAKGCCGGCL